MLSPYTSLLVLETENDYRRYGIERKATADVMTVRDGRLSFVNRDQKDFGPKTAENRREAVEQPASAVANEYFIGAINRVGQEPFGDNDFYGSSYFVDPRGQIVGEAASDVDEELVVRDLDLDMIEEVRQQWAFYRDRRPDAYGDLVAP